MKFYNPKYKQFDLGLLRSSLDDLDKKNRWVALRAQKKTLGGSWGSSSLD